jgi:hypothetical protein
MRHVAQAEKQGEKRGFLYMDKLNFIQKLVENIHTHAPRSDGALGSFSLSEPHIHGAPQYSSRVPAVALGQKNGLAKPRTDVKKPQMCRS